MENNKINVLILCPTLNSKGGVSYYYFLVNKHFSSSTIKTHFFYIGNEKRNPTFYSRLFKSLSDLIKLTLIFSRFDLIVFNPSLDPKSLIRDGIFHLIAKSIFHKKTIVFFHGWTLKFEQLINNKFSKLFQSIYKGSKIIVLSSQFKNTLVNWNIDPKSITVGKTLFELPLNFKLNNNPLNLVFLSRFDFNKGCFTAIKTIELLIAEYPQIKLYMVGDGVLLPKLKSYVEKNNLQKFIIFTGWLDGKSKYEILAKSGIMLYPTKYGEGMPISLLEGMGFGLAIISRPIAGILDVIMDHKNGFLISTSNPVDFASKVKKLIVNPKLLKNISNTNLNVAYTKFNIKAEIKNIENTYYYASL
ncbi:glycosyltransferase, family I [Desulfosarcina variabilis str. Montpellier]|uniref:glycosyltransferase family 4 protein n=1 Tax=Desulfosarcina variabilis TaxID=2300 RepID=UPI003AFAE6AA